MAKQTFALSNRTVELRRDGWYYGDTYGMETRQLKGPYNQPGFVTLMLARQMTQEVLRRQERLARSLSSSPAE